jgi:hypothetical protein
LETACICRTIIGTLEVGARRNKIKYQSLPEKIDASQEGMACQISSLVYRMEADRKTTWEKEQPAKDLPSSAG